MSLSEAQRVDLAAHIRASTDPDVVASLLIRNDTELARLYNLLSTFIVWREVVTPAEYREGLDWTEVENLTVGKARIWEWITENMLSPYDATMDNIRAGLGATWGASNTADALIPISKEPCSITEEIYATGTGTTASPGIRDFVGSISDTDISLSLNENP